MCTLLPYSFSKVDHTSALMPQVISMANPPQPPSCFSHASSESPLPNHRNLHHNSHHHQQQRQHQLANRNGSGNVPHWLGPSHHPTYPAMKDSALTNVRQRANDVDLGQNQHYEPQVHPTQVGAVLNYRCYEHFNFPYNQHHHQLAPSNQDGGPLDKNPQEKPHSLEHPHGELLKGCAT